MLWDSFEESTRISFDYGIHDYDFRETDYAMYA